MYFLRNWDSAQLWQNFGISGGALNPPNPPPRYATVTDEENYCLLFKDRSIVTSLICYVEEFYTVFNSDLTPFYTVFNSDLTPFYAIFNFYLTPVYTLRNSDLIPVYTVFSSNLTLFYTAFKSDLTPFSTVFHSDLAQLNTVFEFCLTPFYILTLI
jgi:hypothetical protein